MARPVFALNYLTRFRCIADRCEDTCCAGMQIPLTAADERRLTTALGAEAQQHVTPLEQPVHGCASVLTRTAQSACRLLDANQLCSLVARAGDDALPDACALFPRTVAQTAERVELAGSLACPEAARLCLLADDGTELVASSLDLLPRFTATSLTEPEPYDALAGLVRDGCVTLLRDRRWPLSTRLMQLAELGARTDGFFFRGSDASNVHERLLIELERTRGSWSETHDALHREEVAGEPVVQLLFSLLAGLRGRGTARFQQLLDVVTLSYQRAALALEPSLGTAPQPQLLWAALWKALRTRHAQSFGGRLDLLLERYWVNDLHRAPITRSPSLSAHAFQLILRAVVLRFLVLGHPVIEQLAVDEPLDERAFDAAFIETAQLFAKHIEKDSAMFEMLAAHFSLESLKTDALTRARRFVIAA